MGCQHILPADDYLCLCLSAAHTLGEHPFRNFFDLSILTYGTSLKAYHFMSSYFLHVFLRPIDPLVWRVLILRGGRVDCAGARSLGQPTHRQWRRRRCLHRRQVIFGVFGIFFNRVCVFESQDSHVNAVSPLLSTLARALVRRI